MRKKGQSNKRCAPKKDHSSGLSFFLNFQVLAVPEIGNSAAKAAAQADFVILSMHRKSQLSVQTRDWIERWSGFITDSKSALGALLDQPGMKRGTVASTLDYLRKVADRKGISFHREQTYIEFATRYSDPEKREEYVKSLEFELVLANGAVYSQKGKFYAVDRNVDVKTGTIRFEAIFPNPGNILRPGQFARVRATTETRKGALLIPQEAVTELQGNYQVAVVTSDNKASIRPVKVGDRFGPMWEIKDGLQAGEKVVVQGVQKVHDEEPVTAKPWIPPAGTPTIVGATGPKQL